MTNPVATIPLRYDSTDLQSPNFAIFLEITQGLNEVAEVRGRDVLVPSYDGQFARNRKFHQFHIVLTGIVRGNGIDVATRQSDFRTNSRLLRVLFDPARDPANLEADLEDGATVVVPARPINIVPNEVIKSEFMFVSVELLAVQPWDFSDIGS